MPGSDVVQQIAISALYYSGAYRILGRLSGGIGSVLTFHRVRPSEGAPFRPNRELDITPEFFEAVVRLLLESDVDIVTLDEARQRLGKSGRARRFVCLTFDDGYVDNYRYAYPVCRHLGVPMTVYVTSGFVDRLVPPWWDVLELVLAESERVRFGWQGAEHLLRCGAVSEKEAAFARLHGIMRTLAFGEQCRLLDEVCRGASTDHQATASADIMTWAQVGEMAQSGIVTIGGHTVTHPRLASLDDDVACREIDAACARIGSQTGRKVEHVAYPFGRPADAGPREFDICRALGLATAVTTRHGNLTLEHGHRHFCWPRLPISGRRQSRAAVQLTLSGALGVMAELFQD
jgi:peptidoglycan/xylan/chitin deacetylase (PgdA/CDA1 family)